MKGKTSRCLLLVGVFLFGLLFFVFPQVTLAHRSGCHNLHTCPSDTNAYVCGDLGYPCDGATTIKNIAKAATVVPLAVEKAFFDTFGRKPTNLESDYWKKRFRAEKDSVYKIRRAMAWHKLKGLTGPPAVTTIVADSFNKVYGRYPTISENQYWTMRVKDKPTETAIRDTMLFHRINDIKH
jgi:hypothetical protein